MQEEIDNIKKVFERDIWGGIQEVLNFQILNMGTEEGPIIFTVGLLLVFVLSIILSGAVLKWTRVLITRRMTVEDRMKFVGIFRFIRYFVYILIFLLILSAAGINIIVLLTASAALLVGLGLAMREIFQDLIGGISIIIDKTVQVGDIIEVENKVGRIIEIKLRTTRALTRDDKIVVIPNHKFISDVVYNYTQNHKNTREVVQVRAAFGSETKLISKILKECATAQKGINPTPEPFVLLEEFTESAFIFGIYFFINDSFVEPKIKSGLRYKIDAAFRKNNIGMPFPQRDVHVFPKADTITKNLNEKT